MDRFHDWTMAGRIGLTPESRSPDMNDSRARSSVRVRSSKDTVDSLHACFCADGVIADLHSKVMYSTTMNTTDDRVNKAFKNH